MSATKLLTSLPPHLAPISTLLLTAPSPSSLLVTLNRPKAFNALSLEQVDYLNPLYSHLSSLPPSAAPSVLLMKGADTQKKTKAFCSGGDVRQIYDFGKQYHQTTPPTSPPGEDLCDDFFRREYALNHKIATASIPQVSVWDGICMGGGAGLSIHGAYRVCTANTVFAMPETGIGLFPDVGGAKWLPFVGTPGWGEYLGLVGERVKGAEGVRVGLGTHYSPEWSDTTEQAFLDRVEAGASVDVALDEVTDAVDDKRTALDDDVERFFHGKDSVGTILDELRGAADTNEFAARTYEKMSKLSPTSMCVTFEQIRRGREMGGDIEKVLGMEHGITQAVMREENGDFYEGIRAVLVDKDGKPVWKHDIKDINEIDVTPYFATSARPWAKTDA